MSYCPGCNELQQTSCGCAPSEPALLHWCRDDLPHAGSPHSIIWGSKGRSDVHTVTSNMKQWHRHDKSCPDPTRHAQAYMGIAAPALARL